MSEIGSLIYSRRKELGLTLEEVGNAVGVSKSTVKKWENGFITNMRRDKIEKLANVLQISPVRLLGIKVRTTEQSSDLNEHLHDLVELGNDLSKEAIDSYYASDPKFIIYFYNKLNSAGRAEATRRVKEMASLDEYVQSDKNKRELK